MTTLGERYALHDKLGEGGMAEVYRATQLALDREVAIKFIKPSIMDEAFVTRFVREAKAVASLSHPNIMQVYDFDEDTDGRCFLVMEMLRGGDLAARLHAMAETGERFALAEAVRIARAVAGALAYAHQRDVVHRDIKPGNIYLTEDGRVVVMDFGIAKVLSRANLTATGTTIGTPHYFAPEQGGGQAIDHRVDIYALGVVVYELLTGNVPYDADSTLGILAQHANAPIPDPRAERPDLPPGMTLIVRRAMAKKPDDRYPDMETFMRDLDAVLEDTPLDADTVILDRAGPPVTAPLLPDEPTVTIDPTPPGGRAATAGVAAAPGTAPAATPTPPGYRLIPARKIAKMWFLLGALVVALVVIGVMALRDSREDSAAGSQGGPAAFDPAASAITPAGEGEYLVVVTDFTGDETAGVDATRRIVNSLRTDSLAATLGERFRVEQVAAQVASRADAEALAAATGAYIVVWGVQDAAGLEVIVQAHGYPARTLTELRFVVPPGDDFGALIADEVPLVTSLYAQVLSMQRLMTDAQFLPLLLLNFNQWAAWEGRELNVVPSTPLDRYVTDMMLATVSAEDSTAVDAAATAAINLVPDDPVLYFMRWSVNGLTGEHLERAWADAERLVELLPPGNGFGAWTLTATAMFNGDLDYVIDYTDQLEDPASQVFVATVFYRAMALLARGEFQAVLVDLTAVDDHHADMSAGFPANAVLEAVIYEIAGDTTRAEETWQTVRASRVLESVSGLFTGGSFGTLNNMQQTPVLLLFGGLIMEANGQDALVGPLYSMALAETPGDYLLNWRRALLAEEAGDYALAYDHYLRAYENAPVPFPVAAYQLARLIHQHGDALTDPVNVCGVIVTAQTGIRTDLEFYAPLRDQIAALHEQLDC